MRKVRPISWLSLITVSVMGVGCRTGTYRHDSANLRPVVTCQAPDPSTDLEIVVQPGDTLEAISTRRYGHRSYARVIRVLNGLESDTSLTAGGRVRTTDLRSALLAECAKPTYSPVAEWIACARAKFMSEEPALQEIATRIGRGHVNLPATMAQRLADAAADVEAAIAKLQKADVEGDGVPELTIRQLGQVVGLLRALARGEFDGYGYDQDLVNQRLAHAMTNLIVWARSGYR
jgi:hypothetical protein